METLSTNVPTQVLQFRLDGEYFAFDVLRTREVLALVKVTPLPSSLEYLSGVINLRGGVIPGHVPIGKFLKKPSVSPAQEGRLGGYFGEEGRP